MIENGLITFDDVILLLVAIFGLSFVTYIISHFASAFIHLFAGLAQKYKHKKNCNVDYNKIPNLEKYNKIPVIKEVKARAGKYRIPFFAKRR